MDLTINQLRSALRQSRSNTTTSTPNEWDARNAPERGQCVPTALIVQDYFGGTLERLATLYQGKRETHYRNILPDGTVIDLSRAQYPDSQQLDAAPLTEDLRTYVLQSDDTAQRYQQLSKSVSAALRKNR